ncbi:hypothetical protein AGLY_003327 [Aphis glycines]|uniref:C2H2-type domain-containing protein n=1 Tax=Aphis glycines TaxID=307491 RepID=A0A6G0U2K8_APHGL|nr:hypothetical protein AGLY_003327 [Aphis glycines]
MSKIGPGVSKLTQSEEASSVAAFLVLPFLFSEVPTKRKRGKSTWKPSKNEMKDGLNKIIKHVTHDFKEYTFVELNCNRSFYFLNSFKKHLATHLTYALIPTVIDKSNIVTSVDINLCPDKNSKSSTNPFHIIAEMPNSANALDNFNDLRLTDNHIGKLLASLYSNAQIPRNVIQLVIEGMADIIEDIKNSLLNCNLKIPHDISNHIKSVFKNIDTTFSNLNIEYKQKGSYIPPQEYVVGGRLNNNKNKKTFSVIPTNCTAQFIPTRHVENPLGIHSGIHKLDAVYLTVPCIPIHRQASLNNIFLTPLFHSSDRQQFGNNIIFRPLIDELNYLKETGIEVNTDKFEGNIKFELNLIIRDNLLVHSISGFVESFSSNCPCRMCKIKKEDMRKQCYVDVTLQRSWEQYNLDVSEGDITRSGIKEACVWHDVKHFRVLDQVGVDIMHDLLEGVCKYDMAFLIFYYVNDLKLFSLEVLNDRIVNFNYEPDNGNKPSVLNIENIREYIIHQSASKMMTLVRYFGLLIGDFIPKNDPVWYLYILLRQILDLITSSSLQKGSCELLQTLIAEHHDLYLKYSNLYLKPKYHFMLHYHTLMNKLGPFVSLWSMRFEAKHRISKISANTSINRRNICKTLAIKHQLQLNDMFLKGTLSNEIEIGPSKLINDTELEEIKTNMQIDSIDLLIKSPWISIKGTKYKPKMNLIQLCLMNIYSLRRSYKFWHLILQNLTVVLTQYFCTQITSFTIQYNFSKIPNSNSDVVMGYEISIRYLRDYKAKLV